MQTSHLADRGNLRDDLGTNVTTSLRHLSNWGAKQPNKHYWLWVHSNYVVQMILQQQQGIHIKEEIRWELDNDIP